MEKQSLGSKKISFYIFGALMFVGILFILSFVGYSDGDDAFFYEYANKMNLLEYLSWRYQTWVGRMAAEALVWFTFRRGIWFWRVVNAMMLVLLPVGIWKLAGLVAGVAVEQGTAQENRRLFSALLLGFTGYLFMDIMTVGYAAVWVNGSIFYTWSFTCGVFALLPVANALYGQKQRRWYQELYAVFCCVIAAMSIEQMGAVLLTLEFLTCIALLWKKKKIPAILASETVVTAASFAILLLAPGNSLRVAQETINWLPQYDGLTFGEHCFITVQWLLSSFANENCAVLCALWIAAGCLVLEQKKKRWLLPTGIFLLAGLLRYAGVSLFCDMGLGAVDSGIQIQQVPVVQNLTAGNIFAMVWWIAALGYTFFLVLRVSEAPVTTAFIYLAGIASEAIMYFSPTIYASGARVYYLTDLLYIFLILMFFLSLREKRHQRGMAGLLPAFGIFHFCIQIPVLWQGL